MIIASDIRKDCPLLRLETERGERVFIENDDNAAILRLQEEAKAYRPTANGGKRLECFLVLKEQTSLWLLQTIGLPEGIMSRVDVLGTTEEDLIAKTILVRLPKGQHTPHLCLDHKPISIASDGTAHLVVIGFSAQAEALVMNAALVAHYPNYCRDTRLRTRITIIDDNVHATKHHLTQRYAHLFDNSYHRTIDLSQDVPLPVLHRPKHEARRKDFVDIEWEFISGNLRNEAVRQKLTEWSETQQSLLTVAICHEDEERNISEVFSLPEALYAKRISILCVSQSRLLGNVNVYDNYASICWLNSDMCHLDTLRELKRMAKRINYIYNYCRPYDELDPRVTAPSRIDEEEMEALWDKVGTLPKVYSNLFNAMTLGTKMHSIGHEAQDWETYYALSAHEIDLLCEVEHNRWSVEELILGYRPADDSEQQLVENDPLRKKRLRANKVHYDLRAFDDLREDETGKNVQVYDLVLTQGIPLIMKSCITD